MPCPSYTRGECHDLFELAAQAFLDWHAGEPEPIIEYDGDRLTLTDICKLVRNSTWVVPGTWSFHLREFLDFKSRTYAAISRSMVSYLRTN
jgi:hypothetical protein